MNKLTVTLICACAFMLRSVANGTFVASSLKYDFVNGNPVLQKGSIPTDKEIVQACGGDETCEEYEKTYALVLKDNAFAKSLEMVDVTPGEHSGDGEVRKRRSPSCPTYDDNITNISRRSLSPWTYIRNVDRTRLPVVMLDAVCLCGGCYDISSPTLEEDINLYSTPISGTISVRRIRPGMSSVPDFVNLNTGCKCMVPL
ncbi:uncharacterized protein LOC113474946 [Ciona intestinalis]